MTTRRISDVRARALLAARVKAFPSMRAASREWGVSAAYLSDVLRGNRTLGKKLARLLGLRKCVTRTTTYESVR